MAIVSASATVTTADGRLAATVAEVPVGGGVQVKTVDGSPVDHVHDCSAVFHVRLVSTDSSVPDDLREAATFDEAVEVASKYADRLDERAAQAAADLDV